MNESPDPAAAALARGAPAERIDPELAAALAAIPKGPHGIFDVGDLAATRAAVRAQAEQLRASETPDPAIAIGTAEAPRPGGGAVPVRLLRPVGAEALPVLLWFHGGGQVIGSADQEDGFLERLCATVGCAALSIDYRLAPEWRAPAAAEDGCLAYLWLLDHARELGLDPSRVGLAGASGGGGVAAATALMLRDRGAPAPRLLSLSYPMLDDRNETPSSREITDVGVWDRRNNQLAWAAVLGDLAGGEDVTPWQAAGRAPDLSGLPPTFIAVGEVDVFRDEDVDFARRLIASGVPTELHVFAGAYHAWDVFAPDAELTSDFQRIWHGYMRRGLAQATGCDD